MNKCLVCFAPLEEPHDSANNSSRNSAYHPRCAKALFETAVVPTIDIDMNALAEAGLSLLRASGSVAGVQKKLSVDRHPDEPRRLNLQALGGRFILKPPVDEYPNLVENETFCMELSRCLGPARRQGRDGLDPEWQESPGASWRLVGFLGETGGWG